MILEYADQKIDLFGGMNPTHIGLLLSGGLDSTSLFYLICKHFPDVQITPIIGIDAYAQFDTVCAKDSIEWMKQKFPNHRILETQSFNINHLDPYWLKIANDMHSKGSKERVMSRIPEGTSKNLQMRKANREMFDKIKFEYLVTGTTANPPDFVMKERGFFHLAEPSRNEPHNRDNLIGGVLYTPYININKKFIAEIYRQNDLMKDLYPFTSSCVGMPDETDNGSHECGKCFWCKEKEWGFE